MEKVFVHIDGGARGNPGPAALGVAILNSSGEVVKRYSQFLGKLTNNEAEYQALIFALKKLKLIFGKEKLKKMLVEIRSDSELLVRQMQGRYKVIDSKIQRLFLQAWNLKVEFGNLNFLLVRREKNKIADKLVNEALDKAKETKSLF
ncbi:ribonuclease HI family protein [bacterium]|nr:ribonuclease HI family protein [bacterium]